MGWRFSARSKRELRWVHPHLLEVVEYARKYSPIDFGVHEGLRSPGDQRDLVDRGVSRTMNSRHLMQRTGFGHAVDLVPYINGKLRWEWAAIYELAQCLGEASRVLYVPIRWGGVWDHRLGNLDDDLAMEVNAYGDRRRAKGRTVFTDGCHYELPNIRAYR